MSCRAFVICNFGVFYRFVNRSGMVCGVAVMFWFMGFCRFGEAWRAVSRIRSSMVRGRTINKTGSQ